MKDSLALSSDPTRGAEIYRFTLEMSAGNGSSSSIQCTHYYERASHSPLDEWHQRLGVCVCGQVGILSAEYVSHPCVCMRSLWSLCCRHVRLNSACMSRER